MKMPISFKEFSSDPVKGLLFIVVIAIAYLYIDIRMNYSGQVNKCDEEVVVLDQKIDRLTEHVRRSDSTLGYMISKVEMLQIISNAK